MKIRKQVSIKAIVFDLYGTLVDIKTDEEKDDLWLWFKERLQSISINYDIQELKHTYETKIKELEKEIIDEKPEIDILKVFQHIFENKGSSPSKETVENIAYEFRVQSREKLVMYEGVFELLDYLKESNIRSILLSNAQRVFTMPEILELELDQKLDKIYLSSDIGAAKPSKKFFDYMLNKEELSAEECLFVGNDYIADIEGSRNVGMESIYIHTSCSPEIKKDFSCLHKIMNEDFKKVVHYIKNHY